MYFWKGKKTRCPIQGRIQKIQKEGAEETDDAVVHHSGSICDQTLGSTLRTFQNLPPPPLHPLNPPIQLNARKDNDHESTQGRSSGGKNCTDVPRTKAAQETITYQYERL